MGEEKKAAGSGEAEGAELEGADDQYAFGPSFFLEQLGAFVDDHCPDRAKGLPRVHIHLADGEVLDLCHIIALAPHWIVIAVWERSRMHTEIVPYGTIIRVSVRPGDAAEPGLGFNQKARPAVHVSQRSALRAAAGLPSVESEGGNAPRA